MSFTMLPAALMALLLSTPVFSAPTSINDQFRAIALRFPRKPDPPICCLQPLASLELVEEEVLLSFEDWKAKQTVMQVQERARVDHTNRSGYGRDAGANGGSPGATGNESATAPSDAPFTPNAGHGTTPEDAANARLEEPVSPHFRVPLTDRFNYAALDCSARVHTAHRSAKSPSSILSSKRDKYMLSPCKSSKKEKQYVVVELCEDVRIDTVQLANFEFFSGVFKDFTVSVAKTYSTDEDGWTVAGIYKAKNVRGVQSFHPPTSLRDFYRYIRIDFHSHYGSEYYCPVSLLRVYGLTHLEQWKWDIWEAESRAKRDELEQAGIAYPPPVPISTQIPRVEVPHISLEGDGGNTKVAALANNDAQDVTVETSSNGPRIPSTERNYPVDGGPTPPDARSGSESTLASYSIFSPTTADASSTSTGGIVPAITSTATLPLQDDVSLPPTKSKPANESLKVSYENPPESSDTFVTKTSSAPAAHDIIATSSRSSSRLASSEILTASAENSTRVPPRPTAPSSPLTSSATSTLAATTPSIVVTVPYIPPPLVPAPTGGESIYRTIMNRLTALEANHTLYVRYVEQQTNGVRDVLKRLGEDVGRLEGIGKSHVMMHQRHIHEWEKQRIQLQMEYGALLSRVDYLSDEIILEKRLGIAQLCLLLAVLVFMGLTRGSRGESVVEHAPVKFNKSMREWGKRHLNFSGDWTSRFKIKNESRSRSPAPRQTGKLANSSPLTFAQEGVEVEFPIKDTIVKREPLEDTKVNLVPNNENGHSRTQSGSRSRTSSVRTPMKRHLKRPITPTIAAFRPQIQRSNSQGGTPMYNGYWTAVGPVPKSAKRWARTAHLHEVRGGPSVEDVSRRRDGSQREEIADVFTMPSRNRPRIDGMRSADFSDFRRKGDGPSAFPGHMSNFVRLEEGAEGDPWIDMDISELGSDLNSES